VRIFRLCHTCPFLSSAFLISRRDQSSASVLYLGDTGPDDIEKIIQADNTTYSPNYLNQLWKAISPLVAANQLKAIFIEVSFPNSRPDHLLFGHLTPKWLLKELNVLKSYHSIEKVKIIVTHIKPEKGAREKIIEQLKSEGDSNFNFIFLRQGEAIWL
jgi:3',5'-cyclic-nucleotide phosphodiesterase